MLISCQRQISGIDQSVHFFAAGSFIGIATAEFLLVLALTVDFLVEEMDQADEELRLSLRKLWPLQAKKKLIELAVPPNSGFSV